MRYDSDNTGKLLGLISLLNWAIWKICIKYIIIFLGEFTFLNQKGSFLIIAMLCIIILYIIHLLGYKKIVQFVLMTIVLILTCVLLWLVYYANIHSDEFTLLVVDNFFKIVREYTDIELIQFFLNKYPDITRIDTVLYILEKTEVKTPEGLMETIKKIKEGNIPADRQLRAFFMKH